MAFTDSMNVNLGSTNSTEDRILWEMAFTDIMNTTLDSRNVTEDKMEKTESSASVYVKLYIASCTVLGLVGILGNGLVLYMAESKGPGKKIYIRNPYLINLTVMDLLTSAAMLVVFGLKIIIPRVMNLTYCFLIHGEGLVWIFAMASPMAMVIFTFQRYCIVIFPNLYKHSKSYITVIMISLSWIAPITWNLGFIIQPTKVIDGICYFIEVWDSLLLAMVNLWGAMIMSYLLPLLVFIFCYTHMLFTIHKHQKNVVQSLSQMGHLNPAKINITITLLLVCIFFILLQTPSVIFWSVYQNGYIEVSQNSPLPLAFDTLTFASSVINPFIYVYRIQEFRKKISALVLHKAHLTQNTNQEHVGYI